MDKRSRPEPVNPERDNMQKKVVAELTTSLVNRKPQQQPPQQKRVTAPAVGTTIAGGIGAKERMMRSGSVGTNLGTSASAIGGTQTSQVVGGKFQRTPMVDSDWTEFTGVTPKGSQIVGSTTVANGNGPMAGNTAGSLGGGGGGYSSVSGTSTTNPTRVTSLSLIPSTRASTHQAVLICVVVCVPFSQCCMWT